MKRTLALASPGMSRLRCLLLLLHLPAAALSSSSSGAPSGQNPLLPLLPVPRKPLARSPSAAGLLPKGLVVMDRVSSTTGKTNWLVGKQLVASLASQTHLRVLPRHRRGHQQPRSSSSSSSPGRTPWTTAQHRTRRRAAAARLHHAQLMRVGCLLGTCQVQNLSHRLWQLKGQSGRQDASPMNPSSPHSYG